MASRNSFCDWGYLRCSGFFFFQLPIFFYDSWVDSVASWFEDFLANLFDQLAVPLTAATFAYRAFGPPTTQDLQRVCEGEALRIDSLFCS